MGRLAEAIIADDRVNRQGPRCSVQTVLAELDERDPETAADLRAALASRVKTTAIVRGARTAGITLGRGPVERHRRGDCRCSQPAETEDAQ